MAQNPDTPNENDRTDGVDAQRPNRGRGVAAAFKRHPLIGTLIACSVLVAVAGAAWIHFWNSGLPSTKHEAVMGIVAKLSAADRRLLAQTRRDNLGMFHMGWGMGIRNGLGLWGKNKRLMRDISGGEPMHTDNMSGIIMVAVWDELHKGEQIPNFDVSDPSKFFRQIDTFLRGAKAKNETALLVHTPVWVLKDRSPYMVDELTHSMPRIVDEAKRIIAHKEPLTYLALQYLTEVERTGSIFQEIEPLLDDMTVVPLPQRVRSQAENEVAAPTYSWGPRPSRRSPPSRWGTCTTYPLTLQSHTGHGEPR
ncbi:MAG: hypothetical protein IPL39_20225 [Opitutaceae bacterium]|nr:hypothetical protein [Opitutaceae bacterium]